MVYGNQQAERSDIVSYLLYSTVVYSFILKVIYVFIAIYDLEVKVFDIVATYFNADVPEGVIIYIRQPYSLDNSTRYVCRLKKVLYGLYSSPK